MNQKREINNSYHSQLHLKISQASEVERWTRRDRQPFAGAFSKDEIQSLEELDSERLSANWHIVLLRT